MLLKVLFLRTLNQHSKHSHHSKQIKMLRSALRYIYKRTSRADSSNLCNAQPLKRGKQLCHIKMIVY